MIFNVTFLPLLGSIVAGFFGRKIGLKGAELLASLLVTSTTFFAINGFLDIGFNNAPVIINTLRWIETEWFNVIWGFLYDSLTVTMLIPVLIISTLVHIYSVSYMSSDPHIQRFFSYLSLFTFMMIILVSGGNYLLLFVGWEGVGVCSYLLVSFWFTRIAANQSSVSAFLTNRVGDCFLTVGLLAILWTLGNLDYSTVFSLAPYITDNAITIIAICLLIGAMAKSSQVGLHVWLPMAMEGPTPVSALIHAATMVTAGVYLLIRSSPLIEFSNIVLLISLWLGAITTVFSSLIGLFQQDIKKVIAYSTMSQLGMMVISIGLSSYNLALFHLVNHAFYKGLLFLGAGSVIHAVNDNQDFRRYGGLKTYLPLTYSVMLIASLSLVAFPFMTGFYSKDFILESAFGQYSYSSIAVYIIAVIGAIFTTLYSVKVLYLTFLTSPNGPNKFYHTLYYNIISITKRDLVAHEGNIFLTLPLVVLAIFSIFFGFITKDIFIGLGTSFFIDNSIFIHPIHEITIDTEFAVSTLFKLLPLIFTISFTVIAIMVSEFLGEILLAFKFSRFGYNVFGFFNQRFLIELFYNKFITKLVLNLGGQTTKVLDKGSIEYIGPFGLEIILLKFSKLITSLNTTTVPKYGAAIVVGLITNIVILKSGQEGLNLLMISMPMLIIAFLSILYTNNSNTEGQNYLLGAIIFNYLFDNLNKKSPNNNSIRLYSSSSDDESSGDSSSDDSSEKSYDSNATVVPHDSPNTEPNSSDADGDGNVSSDNDSDSSSEAGSDITRGSELERRFETDPDALREYTDRRIQEERQAAEDRIRELCREAGVPERADEVVASGQIPQDLPDHLINSVEMERRALEENTENRRQLQETMIESVEKNREIQKAEELKKQAESDRSSDDAGEGPSNKRKLDETSDSEADSNNENPAKKFKSDSEYESDYGYDDSKGKGKGPATGSSKKRKYDDSSDSDNTKPAKKSKSWFNDNNGKGPGGGASGSGSSNLPSGSGNANASGNASNITESKTKHVISNIIDIKTYVVEHINELIQICSEL